MSLNPQLQLTQEPSNFFSPQTLASAASVTPTTAVAFITGTVQIATIVPPVPAPHILVFIFTDDAPGEFLLTGNISAAVTPVKNSALVLQYDSRTQKYYPGVTGDATINAPGGASFQIQYNDDGTFGASEDFTFETDTVVIPGGPRLLGTANSLVDGAGEETGTLTNAPTAGDPAKWIAISDNGTTLYIPAWAAPA